jgi:hypothetical protein
VWGIFKSDQLAAVRQFDGLGEGESTNSMAPAVFVDLDLEPRRHARLGAVFTRIAHGAGPARAPARAGVLTFPWPRGVVLADPAAVFAQDASGRVAHREVTSLAGAS